MQGIIRRGFGALIPVVFDEDVRITANNAGFEGSAPILGVYSEVASDISMTYRAKNPVTGTNITSVVAYPDFASIDCVNLKSVNTTGTTPGTASTIWLIVGGM